MAQNISLLGATYSAVPAVLLPKQGGGTARFDDASITTAVASDVASGKQFLAADGTITTGTASGGGGGSSYTLVASQEFNINQTSTTAATIGSINLGYHTASEILYVRIRDKAGHRAGYFYGSDNFIIDMGYANGSATLQSYLPRAIYAYNSSLKLVNPNSTSSYTSTTSANGVIATGINKNGVITITAKYNSSYGTINGTFKVDVYKLQWPDNINPFN